MSNWGRPCRRAPFLLYCPACAAWASIAEEWRGPPARACTFRTCTYFLPPPHLSWGTWATPGNVQGSLLVGRRDQMGHWGANLGQLCSRQTPSMPHCCFGIDYLGRGKDPEEEGVMSFLLSGFIYFGVTPCCVQGLLLAPQGPPLEDSGD